MDQVEDRPKKQSCAEFYSKFSNFQLVMNNCQGHLKVQEQIEIYHRYIIEHELYLRSIEGAQN